MLKTNFQAFQQRITLITSEKQSNVATVWRSDKPQSLDKFDISGL